MRWPHWLAINVVDLARERAGGGAGLAGGVAMVVGGKLGLHRLEQRSVDDRLALTGVRLAAMDNLAAVDLVLQDMRES